MEKNAAARGKNREGFREIGCNGMEFTFLPAVCGRRVDKFIRAESGGREHWNRFQMHVFAAGKRRRWYKIEIGMLIAKHKLRLYFGNMCNAMGAYVYSPRGLA